MTSEQAKQIQNYREHPETCSTCAHFEKHRNTDVHSRHFGATTSRRCSWGKFDCEDGGTCDHHEPRKQII